MLKKIFVLVLFFILNLSASQTFALEQKAVTIVNPIRGNDFWAYPYDLLETPKKQLEVIKRENLRATWLIRYDALKNDEVVQFLKTLTPDQEVGIFFEVTPSLANDAGVRYNQSQNWHWAKSILLTGYTPDDRKKMIDKCLSRYKEIFGKNPKSTGAWWIDANSLKYLKVKYDISITLDVSDQFSTDGYQVWGQYWSTPFYPSKSNALMPAQSTEQKLGIVTIQWAQRDPFNGYGTGVFESTYSVQANDYLLHDLGLDYFKKLIAIYPQVTVGLENDFDWKKFGEEYSRQISSIGQLERSGNLKVFTMDGFAKDYSKSHPQISSDVLITADDPLGTSGKVVWYQSPKYRVAWFYGPFGSVIRDLRELNDSKEEECIDKACDNLKLAFSSVSSIDEVNFGTRWVIDEGKISDVKVEKTAEGAMIVYKNQAGLIRTINFLKNDIKIDNDIKPISSFILQAVESSQNSSSIKSQDEKDFISKINWQIFLPQFIISTLKFILFSIIFFLIPGYLITKKLLFSIPVGWVIFTLLSFGLGYLHLDNLIWLLPIVSSIGYFSKGMIPKFNFTKLSALALPSLVVILGSVSWLVTQVKNGVPTNYGFGYWGPNGHDAVWHLSLISELKKNVPPQNPVFSGEQLHNYHYFFDLLVAKTSLLFSIDQQDLLFRLFPLVIALLSGFIMYKTCRRILTDKNFDQKFSNKAALIATFFLYFGGSFGWVVSFFRNRDFGGETMFWAQQSISTLLNPPFAISITLFLTGLYYYHRFWNSIKSENKNENHRGLIFRLLLFFQSEKGRSFLVVVLVWGSIIEFKAYAGILILIALFLESFGQLLKRNIQFLYLALAVLGMSLLVFLPSNFSSQSLVEFKPLWLVDTMMSFEDRLFLLRLYLTMQSGVFYKVIPSFAIAILIFLIGNMGTRFLSLLSPKNLIEHRFLGLFTLAGIMIPLTFIQKGTNWNIVQFFYYSLLILGFFAAISITKIITSLGKIASVLIVLIIIILTIPTSLSAFPHYLPKRPPAKLSSAEIEALNILKKLPQGVVLSFPYEEKLAKKFDAPKPLAFYTSTGYISAFSGHSVFLEDMINLEILGIDFKGRLNLIREIAKGTEQSKKILDDNNISYVYILKNQNLPVDEGRMGISKIFGNDEVELYKVNLPKSI